MKDEYSSLEVDALPKRD